MFDDNCSLHTVAAVYNILNNAQLTPTDVSNRTGFMEGPGHEVSSIAEMFRQLRISDGTYTRFDSIDQAEALMNMRAVGTPFGFGYLPTAGGMGHIIVAIKSLGTIVYRDYQIHERQGPYFPIELARASIPNAGYAYYVFRPGIVLP